MRNLLESENGIRLSFFFGGLLIICAWEIIMPRRKLTQGKLVRWPSNFGIVLINTLFLRWIFPTTAIGVALISKQNALGVFHFLSVPFPIAFISSVILLDLTIYLQHVMSHAVPLFWRLHRMHHTDLDLDVTSGARFHPLEMGISMVIKFSVIILLGAPPLAVLVFEIILNTMAMFNHGNIYLSPKVDQFLRWIFVTPDMHRIHHSIRLNETNSNFGFNLSWWDRLLGTYQHIPQDGHEKMTIGITLFRNSKYLKLHWLLVQPFLSEKDK